MFFAGPWGTGKTYYAIALLNSALDQGRPGMFATVPEMLAAIRRTCIPGTDVTAARLYDTIQAIDLLVLDDLGVEKVTDWVAETFYRILNARYLTRRQTILTTNATPAELNDRLGMGLVSRMAQMCVKIDFSGPDRRLCPEGTWLPLSTVAFRRTRKPKRP